MDDRANAVTEILASILTLAIVGGLFVGGMYCTFLLFESANLMDSPDMECSDIETPPQETEAIVLYATDNNEFFGSTVDEGSVIVYQNGTVDTTGPIELENTTTAFESSDFYVFADGDTYTVIDAHNDHIAVGDGDEDAAASYRDQRETYVIHDTCEVTVA